MNGSDPIYQAFKAERERQIAELLREREYRRAFQAEPPVAGESAPAALHLPLWQRLARALHLPHRKTAPRSV